MTKEELKAMGLTDEQIAKITEDYGKNYVSKAQFNAKNEELKTAKAEAATQAKELDKLKKDNKDNEDLVKQIDTLKKAQADRQKEYDASIKKMQIDGIVDRSLMSAKAKNAKAVKALLDLQNVEIDGDSIKGLDAQLKKLKESDAYLFEAEKKTEVNGLKPPEGAGGPDAGGISQEQKLFESALGI